MQTTPTRSASAQPMQRAAIAEASCDRMASWRNSECKMKSWSSRLHGCRELSAPTHETLWDAPQEACSFDACRSDVEMLTAAWAEAPAPRARLAGGSSPALLGPYETRSAPSSKLNTGISAASADVRAANTPNASLQLPSIVWTSTYSVVRERRRATDCVRPASPKYLTASAYGRDFFSIGRSSAMSFANLALMAFTSSPESSRFAIEKRYAWPTVRPPTRSGISAAHETMNRRLARLLASS
mmetsp:Transcript_7015/g.18175  ORF Transcript_7015/g.18175 Transcript_7015/m.18175 type:complete len:242 (+) Transcript_7015:1368-2093(+)